MASLDFLKRRSSERKTLPETRVEGTPLSYGLVVGQARFYNVFAEGSPVTARAHSTEEERARLISAFHRLREHINGLLAETAITLTEESLEVFDVYRLLVQDPLLEREILNGVDQGRSASEALEMVLHSFRRSLWQDAFWKTRFYDLQYLFRQLRHYLKEDTAIEPPEPVFSSPVILVAPYVSPADLLNFYRSRHVVGLVLSDESSTSHTAILARSLHLPTIGGISLSEEACPQGTQVLLDAFESQLIVRPSSETLERIQKKTQTAVSTDAELPLRAVTKDGVEIHLELNANTEADFELLAHPLIKGVGLFRTEILLMSPEIAGDVLAQETEYKRILDKSAGKPVVFRTLDMADDKDSDVFAATDEVIKSLPELQRAPLKEEHKMGEELVLDGPLGKVIFNRFQLLSMQIRALLRARANSQDPYGDLHIMIPMISDIVELKAYQKIIEAEALHEAKHRPSLPSQIKLGIMIEVPSLFYQIHKLKNLVDFVSIGTNDLFQYFFAASRWSSHSRRAYDVLSPSFVQFIGSIMHQLIQMGTPVHVCGEMASHPLPAMVLVGLGVRHLSLPPHVVRPIARMVQSLNCTLLEPYLRQFRVEPLEFSVASARQYDSSVDLRQTLQQFAQAFGVLV